ncbi:MAG: TIGR03087 family PEP-CTERM/XrtA system glycosyltransferase [Methylococcaceae bacterium]|nr:TIGR03087 family PEP-CTERM/XrtA system glycosyltransferase [Methylococcaceae bacterium]MCI0667480.1 TIGR03087 family PEP-CTERM/XrtA system glycosyltransferase [Methylococcaceae bacterium]MCI0733299.1 TIGR03087 family PEP-CTERM/XrtA system glycosyltransferase [Methylococcaceae bacterium]
MKDLLFLVHRIPYPPNKGDKIRSYHLFRHLAERFRVHLGTFVDDHNDSQYIDPVKSLCASSHIVPFRPGLAKLTSLTALISGEPLTLRYYPNRSMRRWVKDVIAKHAIRKVLVYSSVMAQFVPASIQALKLIDFVDVDSDKWRQFASRKNWPLSWIYQREGGCLLRYDRRIAENFDQCFFVSKAEAAFFENLAPESRERIHFFNNGVDADYFSPDREYPNPYGNDDPTLVFTGAMDYWANIDAVNWFSQKVFPEIRQGVPDARFYIVGSKPANQVKMLEKIAGHRVTGRVDDIRPYLHHATVAVTPLRIARGIQNKVLEAMAMNKPILATPAAMDGIPPGDGLEISVSEDPRFLAEQAIRLLKKIGDQRNCRANREFVLIHYNWSDNLKKLDTFLLS